MFHAACRVCMSSEYKEEIEKLLSQKLKFREIARRYQNVFGVSLRKLEQSIGNHRKKHFRELSRKEQELLERFEKREVSLEELNRFIAVRVFENMIRNPHRFKFNDFIRMQQLQMKKEKMKQKRLGETEAISLFFKTVKL